MPHPNEVWQTYSETHTRCMICDGQQTFRKGKQAFHHFYRYHRDGYYRENPGELQWSIDQYGLPPEEGEQMGRLARALRSTVMYNAAAKKEFKLAAMQGLKKLAEVLRLELGTYEVRWNAGGIAVSGEATLHHDRFYIQISQGGGPGGFEVLYRTCNGRRDYSGGSNKWTNAVTFESDNYRTMAGMVERMVGVPFRLGAQEVSRIKNTPVDRGNGPGED